MLASTEKKCEGPLQIPDIPQDYSVPASLWLIAMPRYKCDHNHARTWAGNASRRGLGWTCRPQTSHTIEPPTEVVEAASIGMCEVIDLD